MSRLTQCPCGSGEYPDAKRDGYGIFLCYACDKCWPAKRRKYRPDIMSAYACDEPIEPED